MAKIQKRSSSAGVTKSAIASASSALEALPAKPKQNWSLRETVALLQDSIMEALSKGYSYPEVSKMLAQKGVKISPSSLKSYLSSAKRGKGTGASKARKVSRKTQKTDAKVVALVPKKATKAVTKTASKTTSKTTTKAVSSTRKKQAAAEAAPAKRVAKVKTTATRSAQSIAAKAAPKTTTRGRKKLK